MWGKLPTSGELNGEKRRFDQIGWLTGADATDEVAAMMEMIVIRQDISVRLFKKPAIGTVVFCFFHTEVFSIFDA